jgi:hypothetical protein
MSCMKIEVSHESPISILDISKEYNDYGYALVHLFETHLDYYLFYKKLRTETDTPVLLDNSIFELGKSFEPKEYVKWIEKLTPNYYIVPDVLESCSGTIEAWKNWMMYNTDGTSALGNGALKIGVVQGKNWNDLTSCYKFISDYADYVAISFDYSYYEYTGEITTTAAGNKLQLWCSGRQRFIRQLIDEGIWRWDKPHHLLGCSLAKEFSYYVDNNIHNIKSVDTSNPVMAGIKGFKYNDTFGLDHKPSTMLADLIEHEVTGKELERIEYNTKMFKKILRRNDYGSAH